MAPTGRITVTNIEKDEKYDLNGTCSTLAHAVSKFQNGAPFNGEVRVNGNVITDMAYALRAGDVVLLLTAAVAGGGVKGAQ